MTPPNITLYLLCGLILGLLNGCTSPGENDAMMPPSPPKNRIQSVIFPDKHRSEPEADAASVTASELPEGVTLKLKGKIVDYTLLQTVPDPEKRTVTVFASPTLPYSTVEEVLERLHKMGFLVSFKSGE